VACPFFYPTEKSEAIAWSFPRRLPLGAGFCGTCRAGEHEVTPADSQLKDFCNLGYAQSCAHLPEERRADCLRFAIAEDEGERIRLHFIYERNHAPVEHGFLEYDWVSLRWSHALDDACAQRQAECYLESYLERHPRPSPQQAPATSA
jgi:hypothetical protein